MSQWNTFLSATFAECRARNIKPWAGGSPMAWASEVYIVMRAQADDEAGSSYMTADDVIDTAPTPEQALLQAEAVWYETYGHASGVMPITEPLFDYNVDPTFYMPTPAWKRDPGFFIHPKARSKLAMCA
jgi:hypothetical protein